jgi:hypothetical protein
MSAHSLQMMPTEVDTHGKIELRNKNVNYATSRKVLKHFMCELMPLLLEFMIQTDLT